mmetsp:Transcript_20673/g.48270  ORF Transcript_20673/g.48270 Transcript_20673/m.48270 type:complete len:675 (+) Transcript_20673:60-2084(+)
MPQRKAKEAKEPKVNGAQEQDVHDMQDLLAPPGNWTDSFIVLKACRWLVGQGLELYGPGPGSASRAAGKKKAEALPLKDAAMQFVEAHKVPVGLMMILVLTCAIIIGGENLDRRPERALETVEDHYGVLGITRDAEAPDIKRAYKTLAKRWHPDKNPNCSACQDTFSKIAVAYETLSDDKKRAAYDEVGGAATLELKSPKSVPLTRENFEELVVFSNDVWIVQVFRPDNANCASFHPFWENQIQKHGHLVRFGRIDVTNDHAKWLPLKVRVLPTILKFGRHLGAVEIFPITQMHETPQALMKFVLTSFPHIGLPLSSDKGALTTWLSSSTLRHKVLFAIPGKSEEERYKSHLIPRKLASRWSDVFEIRTADTSLLHQMQLPPQVMSALPARAESSEKAVAMLFPARGALEPKAVAAFSWPTGEEDVVLELMRFTEMVGVSLSVQSAELLCRSLAIRRVYCLVLLDAADTALSRAARDLRDSRGQYQSEVAEIRAGGGDVPEDEENFIVPTLRLLRQTTGLEASVESCFAPKFIQVETALGGSSAFLLDLDTRRIAPLRGLSSFRGLYPQIAYEDSLNWVDVFDPIQSLPDCSEGVRQRFVRQLSRSSLPELAWQLLFTLFLVEAVAKALTSGTLLWWLGVSGTLLAALARSPPFMRWVANYVPVFLRSPELIQG